MIAQSNYADTVNRLLRPGEPTGLQAIDLFAGCGGLSLGFEAAGIATTGYEMVTAAAATYTRNLQGICHCRKLERGAHYPASADIVIGGPPCQPFSVRGKQQGIEDARDGFPIFIEAVASLQPRLFLFENVPNLLRSHRDYLELILSALRKLGYTIAVRCLNAVDYGVPQNRERVVVVGHQGGFCYPPPLPKRCTVAEAIGDTMGRCDVNSRFLTPEQDAYIARYEQASQCINPRDLYPDRPARTITCRNLAGATSDMQRVRLPDGRRRRITVREAARLQSFPDWFEFLGNETQQFTMIGNAVPPMLAYHLALAARRALARENLGVEGGREWNGLEEHLF